jgi:hypothetical protein
VAVEPPRARKPRTRRELDARTPRPVIDDAQDAPSQVEPSELGLESWTRILEELEPRTEEPQRDLAGLERRPSTSTSSEAGQPTQIVTRLKRRREPARARAKTRRPLAATVATLDAPSESEVDEPASGDPAAV